MQKSDYVFVGWVTIVVIVAGLAIAIPSWRVGLGWLLAGLIFSGLAILFWHCRGAEMEPG
jgi:hypothetical protein